MNENYTQPFYVPKGKGKLNLHTGLKGDYYLPALELAKEAVPLQEVPWVAKQWDKVQQLQNEVEGWREKHAEALLEIDRLRAKVDRGTKDAYTII